MVDRTPVGSRRIRRPEVRRRWLLVWGLVVISGSFLASVALHSRGAPEEDDLFYDPRRVDEEPTADLWSGPQLFLRSSETDRRVFNESGGDYEYLLRTTNSTLGRLGVSSRETRSVSPEGEAVLFLEHALCLSDSEWDSLKTWVEEGGALVFSGPLGVRNAGGEWLNWDRMRSLLHADRLEERTDVHPAFVTLTGLVSPAASDLQGYRIALKQGSHILGFADEEPLAYWSGFHREPIPEPDTPLAAAAARTFGAGRIVWLGFPLGWLHEDPENDRAASAWLLGLLDWCSGRMTLASLDLWPEGVEAAVLLTQDAEEDFGQARAFSDLLDRYGLPGTFLCVSDEAEEHRELVTAIAARHEIGSHSDDHRPIAGDPYKEQKRRLEASARSLARMSGSRPKGFRPPEERFDPHTLPAMEAAGYEYLLGHSSEPWAVPRILSVPEPRGDKGGRLVQIPRLVRDDYNFLILSNTPLDSVAAEFARDLEIVRRYRGVNYVSIHTHLLGRADRIDALGPFLEGLRSQPIWVCTGSGLTEWIVRRSDIRLRVESTEGGPGEYVETVRVMNQGVESVAGLLLVVCGRYGMTKVTGPMPEGSPDRAGRLRYRLGEIPPGGEVILVFAVEPSMPNI